MSTKMPPRGPKTLRVLALDTSSPRGSVALLEGGEVRGEIRLAAEISHSERLLRSIEFVLESCLRKLDEIELVAVGIGPGSFTGIRIGVATALGLAQTLERPLAGVSGLDALGTALGRVAGEIANAPRKSACIAIGIVMDAGRGQVYYSGYGASARRIRRVGRPILCDPSELARTLGRRRVLLAGDGAERYARELGIGRSSPRRLVAVDPFLAAEIGRVALSRPASWRQGAELEAEPLYIRLPDALVKRNAAP